MSTVQLMNPAKNNRQTASILAASSKWTTLAVCLTTGLGVFVWGQDLATKYIPEWVPGGAIIAAIIGLAFAIGAGYLTDIGFGQILQKVLFAFLAKNHPNVIKWNGGQSDYFNKMQGRENIGFILLLVALLAIDGVSTYIIRDPVAQRAGSGQTINVEETRAQIQAEYDKRLTALQATAKEKQALIQSEKGRVAASNPALLRLKAQGNSWATGQIAARQQKATKAYEKERQSAEAAYTATAAEAQAYIQARITEAEEHNRQTEQENRQNRDITSTMYLIFSIGLKLLTILLRIMVVISFCAYSYNYTPDLTGDGVIDYRDVEAFSKKA